MAVSCASIEVRARLAGRSGAVETRDVRRAWEAFHQDGTASAVVRPTVFASWQRSRQHRIAVTQPGAAIITEPELHRLRQRHLAFLRAADPVMQEAREFLASTNSMTVLTDAAGTILQTAGDGRAVDFGYAVKLQRGGQWSEAAIGTNAMGTALVDAAPVQIHAAEHFCSEVQKWTCAAAPVRHPVTGEVLGVVDISGPASTFNPQSLAHAVSMAHQIEALLDRGIKAEHDCVLRYFLDKRALWLNEEIVAFGRGGALIYSTEKALRQIGRRNPDVLGGNGLAVLKDIAPALWSSRLATLLPGASIEVVTQDGQEVGGVLVLHDVRRTRAAPGALAVEGTERLHFDAILGESHAIREAREKALRMAQSGTPVLLEGETGVGKELFARAIHGAREPSGPFVPVNCGGLPRDLVASEIFGYEKGAFTGADAAGRPGKVEAADGGLLCLDEIGEMPLELQSYLLRVLEDGVVYRVGSHEGRRVNLRLVSMTNRDLADEMAAGRFRKDLYYRIATLRLHIPPLRERGDDIVILLEHFAQAAAQRAGREAPRLTAAALDALRAYHWPGNVRELRNVVETLVVLSPGGPIGPEELPAEVRGPRTSQVAPSAGSTDLRSVEQATIAAAVRACGGNLSNAAKYLGIARSTLYVRMAEFELMSPVSQAESNRESRLRKLDVGITSARRGSPYALMSDFKGEGAFTIRPLRCPNWIGAQGTRRGV